MRMAIHETQKQTDIERRLKLLRMQIYGKERESQKFVSSDSSDSSEAMTPLTPTSDITYLYHDLFKIGVLATFALGAQIILFYLLRNNLLRINFF